MAADETRALLEGVPLPLLVVDADDRIAMANQLAKALFSPDLEHRPLVAFFRQPALFDCLETWHKHERASQTQISVAGPGKAATYRVMVSPISYGAQPAALVSFEDQTALEHAEAMRRDFLANVSHELRTPLTALMGFIETLKGAAREDAVARARFLEIMEREAGRMNRLVSDLLNLSRVEAEERARPVQRVDALALLQSSVAALRPVAEAAEVKLVVTGAAQVPPLRGDADQITQVFTNLIENAIKYGGSGGKVTVDVASVERDPVLRGPAIRFDVIDEGEGIATQHLPRLAERFYRVDTHRSRERGGTGLGLAIVKHILNRHRGRLKIASELGKGCVFSVILLRD